MSERALTVSGTALLEPLKGLAQEILGRVKDLCGYREDFLASYIVNSVLSLVEEKEQELLLAMKYDEFVEVSKDDVLQRVVEYLDVLSRTCGSGGIREVIPELDLLLSRYRVFDVALCLLYRDGINGDGVPFVVIEGVGRDSCLDELSGRNAVRVRSRFSELAHYLFRLKQRFENISSFQAKLLVSRVFAFCEQRWLPAPRHSSEEVARELKYLAKTLYEGLCSRVLGGVGNVCRVPEELPEVVEEFLRELGQLYELRKFYRFQLEGIREIGERLVDAVVSGSDGYVTLEAPTGSGKSEVFLLSAITLALVKRFLCRTLGSERCRTPVVVIVYPRLALARDQFERLVRYVTVVNEILERRGMPDLAVSVSVNNMDVLESSKYLDVLGKYSQVPLKVAGECVEVEVSGHYTSIPIKVCRDSQGVFIRYTEKYSPFKCLDGSFPEVRCHDRECGVFCGGRRLGFIKLFKDVVKKSPGDIHVTLFETLRLNILSRSWSALFGDGDVVGGPIMVVLDEIHTYTGIVGARYAYMLRRLMTRSRHRGRGMGFVVVGLSATIPRGSEGFLEDLFGVPVDRISRVMPSKDELIPLGADYFYIVLPNFKEFADPLSVSIQTIMALHFNSASSRPGVKKSLVFVDSLDIVSRLRADLHDAIASRSLQDLRNPLGDAFWHTIEDYGDTGLRGVSADRLAELIRDLSKFSSWSDGELWWPYALECEKYRELCRDIQEPSKGGGRDRGSWRSVRVHTSRLRESVEGPGIVVATSTLEVGVDYEDVSVIYQHGAPPSIAALIQRAGRGGRRVYRNPLLRSVIAVQLSPEIPHQAYLLELFTRYRSLREALDREVLVVATRNSYVRMQTALEAVLDYYVVSGRSTSIDSATEFECELLPSFISNEYKGVSNYISKVLGSDADKPEELLQNILEELKGYCEEIEQTR
jgi:hypothetical protein